MKTPEFVVFLLFFIIVTSLLVINKNRLIYVKSDVDGSEYMVDSKSDERVANVLAVLKEKMFTLRDRLDEDESDPVMKKAVARLKKYLNSSTDITETPIDSNNTSYTINKGEKISFCVRSKKTGDIHDINLLTYVAIHEISHIACEEEDHTELFWKIFGYLAQKAEGFGLYQKIDFNSKPEEYCGMDIKDSVI